MTTETMTTYRRADGDLIFGEWSFATDIDSCQVEADDADEPVEYVEEVWELKSSRSFKLPTCNQCDEPATHWGLCEKHAREDDPTEFDDEPVVSEVSGDDDTPPSAPVGPSDLTGDRALSRAESSSASAPVGQERPLRLGSLCTGYGGLDLAVREVLGGRMVWLSEIDPAPAQVCEVRFPRVPNLGDLTAIDWTTTARIDVMCVQPRRGHGRWHRNRGVVWRGRWKRPVNMPEYIDRETATFAKELRDA